MKKYELTDETLQIGATTLHRILALRNFGDVKAGDLGGFVESEKNLSHENDCWVYENARIHGDAWIHGNAEIALTNHYIVIQSIGSRNDNTTFYRTKFGGINVSCGCFNGSIDEFENKVKETHGDNEHAKAYMLAVELAKLRILGGK